MRYTFSSPLRSFLRSFDRCLSTRSNTSSSNAISSMTTKTLWLVLLLHAYQDADHIYLAMQYVPGGDLRGPHLRSPPHRGTYITEMFTSVTFHLRVVLQMPFAYISCTPIPHPRLESVSMIFRPTLHLPPSLSTQPLLAIPSPRNQWVHPDFQLPPRLRLIHPLLCLAPPAHLSPTSDVRLRMLVHDQIAVPRLLSI
jgi:hypothetical protein